VAEVTGDKTSGLTPQDAQRTHGTPEAVIAARLHPSGFEKADSNFYSLTIASDRRVYCTLSSHDIDTHARAYRHDPANDEMKLAIDFGEATGEAGKKTIPQGKSHSPYFELEGKLYLATHYGFFATTADREQPAPVPAGYKPYPGGHILSYDMASGRTEDLGKAPPEEGIITLTMDAKRGRLYGLTWPSGLFLVFDIATRRMDNLGPVSLGGETGRGDQYRCLVRSFALDGRDGMVYFTNSDGLIQRYNPSKGAVEPYTLLHMKRDIFGLWDPARPGHQGYNWRDILWHEETQVFYGVHPRSGYLFFFDPRAGRLELIERICAEELRRTGHYEPFHYGYLTLQLAPDRKTLYYLTGTYGVASGDGGLAPAAHLVNPGYKSSDTQRHALALADGRRVIETTHLVTYDLATREYADRGVIRLEDGRYPRMSQCHAIHPAGRCYSAPWIPLPAGRPGDKHRWQCDLISFADPLAKKENTLRSRRQCKSPLDVPGVSLGLTADEIVQFVHEGRRR
jgi:hypothetical protein